MPTKAPKGTKGGFGGKKSGKKELLCSIELFAPETQVAIEDAALLAAAEAEDAAVFSNSTDIIEGRGFGPIPIFPFQLCHPCGVGSFMTKPTAEFEITLPENMFGIGSAEISCGCMLGLGTTFPIFTPVTCGLFRGAFDLVNGPESCGCEAF